MCAVAVERKQRQMLRRNLLSFFWVIFFSLFLCLRSLNAFAEEMSFEQLCTYRGAAYINAEGHITEGTADRLKQFISSADYETCDYAARLRLSLSSLNGDTKAGIELGRFFQEQRVIVEIGKRTRNPDCVKTAKVEGFDLQHCQPELEQRSCEGACALAFLGGLDRNEVFSDIFSASEPQEKLGFAGMIAQTKDDPTLGLMISEYLTDIGTDLNFKSLEKPYFPTLLQLEEAGVLGESHIFNQVEFKDGIAAAKRPLGSSSNFNRLEIECEDHSMAFTFYSDRQIAPSTVLGVNILVSMASGTYVYEPIMKREVENANPGSISIRNRTLTVRLPPTSLSRQAISRIPKEISFEWIAAGGVQFDLVALQIEQSQSEYLRKIEKQCVK